MNAKEEVKLDLMLWTGVLAGPIGWLLQFQARYSLVDWACSAGKTYVLHVISLGFLAIALGSGFLSLRLWRSVGCKWPSDSQDGRAARVTFLSSLGVLTSGMFSLVIVAQALPALWIDPCIK